DTARDTRHDTRVAPGDITAGRAACRGDTCTTQAPPHATPRRDTHRHRDADARDIGGDPGARRVARPDTDRRADRHAQQPAPAPAGRAVRDRPGGRTAHLPPRGGGAMTAPYWRDDHVTLYRGDCAEILRAWPDSSVDAVVTDPPYELGFMGKSWDASGIAYDPALWAEVLRVLKPGGHLVAFGGTRTYHRLACAIEDAGFEVRDSLHWIYGSGFPKSYDVGKAIDQAGGSSPAEQSAVLRTARERAGLTRDQVAAAVGCTTSSVRDWEEGRARGAGRPVEHIVPSAQYRARLADLLGYTADERAIAGVRTDRRGDGTVIGLGHSGVEYGRPVTKEAVRWDGWGTALKPAHEPIVLARKPLAGTVAVNVLEYGTGAIHIGACRVPPTGESRPRVDEASQERRYTERGSTNLAALPGAWSGGDPAGR